MRLIPDSLKGVFFSTRKRITVRTRGVRYFILLQSLIVLITVLGTIGAWFSKRSDIKAHSRERVEVQTSLLGTIHTAMLVKLSVFAETLHFPLDKHDHLLPDVHDEIFGVFKSDPSVQRLIALDTKGALIAQFVRDSLSSDHYHQTDVLPDWYDSTLLDNVVMFKRGQIHLLYLHNQSLKNGGLTYALELPLLDRHHKPQGYLLLENYFGPIVSWLFTLNRGEYGTQYLLSKAGECLIPPIGLPAQADSSPFNQISFFRTQYPDEWERLNSGKPTQVLNTKGLFTAYPIDMSQNRPGNELIDNPTKEQMQWISVEHISRAQLHREISRGARIPIAIGGVLILLSTIVFVSLSSQSEKRQLAEKRLEELNQTLTAIIEGSPLAMIVLDPRAKVILWNYAAEKIFGWKREEVIGKFNPIASEEKNDDFNTIFQQVLKDKQPVESTLVRTRQDGSPVELYLWTTAIGYISGRPSGVLGILADISEQRRIQEAEARAERIDTARLMARTVAHEFRQPLAALTLVSELAEMRQYRSEDIARTLNRIPPLVKRMDAMVDKLLNLTELHDKTYWRDINILDLEKTTSEAPTTLRVPSTFERNQGENRQN